MKFILIIWFILSIFGLYAQKAYLFSNKGVEIVFELSENESEISELITISNETKDDIYIPLSSAPSTRYFYQSDYQLHSYNSVIHSSIGPMSIEGSVTLKKIASNESFSFKRTIERKDQVINKYYFAFDFVHKNAHRKIFLKNGKYKIRVLDYFELCHSFSSMITGLPR